MSILQVVDRNGKLVVDSRLVADMLGIQHKNFLATIEKYSYKMAESSVIQPPIIEVKLVQRPQGGSYKEKTALLTESQAKYLISHSRQRLSPESIEYFRVLGFDFSDCSTPVRCSRAEAKESSYSNKLATKLNGKREVRTSAGNIDVLTSTEVIEVKIVSQWKAAIGQVLVYGFYYPRHEKRIHLHGATQKSTLKMISSHCEHLGIKMTWEP